MKTICENRWFFYRSVPAVAISQCATQDQIPVHLALYDFKLKTAVATPKNLYTTELKDGVTIIMKSEDCGINPLVLK